MTILEELRKVATTYDNDYDMLKWLEAHKPELNTLGIWMERPEEDITRAEYLGHQHG